MKQWLFLIIVPGILLAACSTKKSSKNAAAAVPDNLVSDYNHNCTEQLGLNGTWKLVNYKSEKGNVKPEKEDTLIIKSCNLLEYHSVGQVVKRDSVRVFKVTDYCVDFRLQYKNDSLNCITMKRDTLIFSDCSNFESNRYFYKRIAQ